MAVFEYRGLTAAGGKSVRGVRDADNVKALRAALKREGVLITEAQEETKARSQSRRELNLGAFFRRISISDIAMMTRQLATLVAAGIPLVEAVTALTEQVEKHELKRILTQVRDRLNEGSSLAKALEPHPKVFPPLYSNMVAAGEASGTLETVLERLSDYMEGQAKLRGKVGAALAYPMLMVVIGTALLTLMMTVVVPKVTSIYDSLDRALPWYTSLLIGVSRTIGSAQMAGFVLAIFTTIAGRKALSGPTKSAAPGAPESDGAGKRSIWTTLALILVSLLVFVGFTVDATGMYAAGAAGGVVVGFLVTRFTGWLATPTGQYKKDSFLLKVPIFGTLLRMLAVSRFARTLSTLLKAGVPLLKALEIVRFVLDNARLSKVIEEAIGSIREGESIAGPLKRSGDFPPIVIHMIAVGEKSGQLETMLENVARAYDTQVDTTVQALTSLLEPLMMVMMGGAVGFIAFAILMPLIQMNEAL